MRLENDRLSHSPRTKSAARRWVDIGDVKLRDKACRDIGRPRDGGHLRCQSVEFRLRFSGGIVAVFTSFAQGYVSARRVECALTKA